MAAVYAGLCTISIGMMAGQSEARAQGLLPEPPGTQTIFRSAPAHRAYLPARVDLSRYFPEPGHQGEQGSCVGWAVAYAARSYYDIKGGVKQISQDPYSPAFLYNNLVKDSPTGCLTGVRISSALEFVQANGLPRLETFPYVANSCSYVPPSSEVSVAPQSRIKGWKPVNYFQLDTIKGRLAAGDPVIVGIRIEEDIHTLGWGDIYDNTNTIGGFGHAVVFVGYDDKKRAFRFLNSWGPEWSEGGYGWVSYRAAAARLISAFYIKADPRTDLLPETTQVAKADPPRTETPVPVEPQIPNPPPEPEPTPQPAKSDPRPEPKPEPAPPPVEPDPAPVPTPQPAESDPAPVPVPQPAESDTLPTPQRVDAVQPLPPLARLVIREINALNCTHFEGRRDQDGRIHIEGVTGSYRDGVAAKKLLRQLEEDLGSVDIKVRKWPQCEAIETFWAELDASDRPSPAVDTGVKKGQMTVFADKDDLRLTVRAPNFDGHLYAIYLQANGEAVHLTDPRKDALKVKANEIVTLGHGAGQPRYVIGPPFGDEMILFLSSEIPLTETRHKRVQTERDFLTLYRQGILDARETKKEARVSAAAVFLRTEAAQ